MTYVHTKRRKIIKGLKRKHGRHLWLGKFNEYMTTFRKEKKDEEGQEAKAKS